LIGLGVVVFQRLGTTMTARDFHIAGADWHTISAFGVICFGLVGLELASVMGDEIKEPLRTVPFSVLWGGLLSGILYIGATLTLILAIPNNDIGVLQGILEAITRMAIQVDVAMIVTPLALLLSISIAGIAAAWLAGSARIPFVAGLDRYLPARLGELHPRFASPYIALIVHGVLSTFFLAMSFIGANVKEAFVTLLDLAVVLQLVPFLYMYAALIRLTAKRKRSGIFRPITLQLAGVSGLLTTALAMVVAFVPSRQISSVWLFEAKLISGCIFFVGLAVFFFYVYGRRKLA
jgi:amino acid transporter